MSIEERYLLLGLFTWALYQLFKPIGWLKTQKRGVQVLCLPYILAFIVLDALYNAVVGSILFKSLPKEFMFTTRIQRIVDFSPKDSTEYSIALRLSELMNRVDPGHIRFR